MFKEPVEHTYTFPRTKTKHTHNLEASCARTCSHPIPSLLAFLSYPLPLAEVSTAWILMLLFLTLEIQWTLGKWWAHFSHLQNNSYCVFLFLPFYPKQHIYLIVLNVTGAMLFVFFHAIFSIILKLIHIGAITCSFTITRHYFSNDFRYRKIG